MSSWIMKHWLKTHKKEEYPDISITQENDAFHVLPENRHPSEKSIMRMCSPCFLIQHKYENIKRSIDFGPNKSFEEFGNPAASPPYNEPDRDRSQDCVAKEATNDEDLGYACPPNERMRSMGTENDTLSPLYKKPTTASGTDRKSVV